MSTRKGLGEARCPLTEMSEGMKKCLGETLQGESPELSESRYRGVPISSSLIGHSIVEYLTTYPGRIIIPYTKLPHC